MAYMEGGPLRLVLEPLRFSCCAGTRRWDMLTPCSTMININENSACYLQIFRLPFQHYMPVTCSSICVLAILASRPRLLRFHFCSPLIQDSGALKSTSSPILVTTWLKQTTILGRTTTVWSIQSSSCLLYVCQRLGFVCQNSAMMKAYYCFKMNECCFILGLVTFPQTILSVHSYDTGVGYAGFSYIGQQKIGPPTCFPNVWNVKFPYLLLILYSLLCKCPRSDMQSGRRMLAYHLSRNLAMMWHSKGDVL